MVYKVKFNPRLKYGNIPTEYRGGRFQSKKEARKAQELDLLKKDDLLDNWVEGFECFLGISHFTKEIGNFHLVNF